MVNASVMMFVMSPDAGGPQVCAVQKTLYSNLDL